MKQFLIAMVVTAGLLAASEARAGSYGIGIGIGISWGCGPNKPALPPGPIFLPIMMQPPCYPGCYSGCYPGYTPPPYYGSSGYAPPASGYGYAGGAPNGPPLAATNAAPPAVYATGGR